MTEKYRCPVCNHDIPGDLVNFLDHTEKEMVKVLKKKYPQWTSKMGLCPKCKDEYKTWSKSSDGKSGKRRKVK